MPVPDMAGALTELRRNVVGSSASFTVVSPWPGESDAAACLFTAILRLRSSSRKMTMYILLNRDV